MKNIVVTGATSGIGREVARVLLKLGHTVISNTRNGSKAQLVKDGLIRDSGNSNMFFYHSDFEDFKSVRNFADCLKENFNSLDVLINNAGTWEMVFKETRDGIETNLQVNHLSPMLLTLELIPLLKKAVNARIVNTSSGAHRRDILNFSDPEFRNETYNGIASYSQSKLLNLLFSLELIRKLGNTGITVNTVHPGYVKTALFDKMGKRDWEGVPDAATGAQSAVYAALSPELEGVSGKYIYINREDPSISGLAKNREYSSAIWDLSYNRIRDFLSEPGLWYDNTSKYPVNDNN